MTVEQMTKFMQYLATKASFFLMRNRQVQMIRLAWA
jgi:hypothetical protein